MKTVLFIDDEPNVLEGLRVTLRSVRGEWDLNFACGSDEGLKAAQNGKDYDVVVSDLHMPGMEGDELLKVIGSIHPKAVRFVLSGRLDTPNLARAGTVAHQILGKPCDPHQLRARVTRAIGLRDRLAGCHTRDQLLRLCGIPSVPLVFWELQNEIAQADPSIDRVAEIIERDPSMGAKVLQVAHAAHSERGRVTGIASAVRTVGLDNIRSFVLMAGIFEQADPQELPGGITLENLWQHATKVAEYAKRIAACESDDTVKLDEAYTAGLLHDIGLLIIATKMPQQFGEVLLLRRDRKLPLYKAEQHIFGATHAEIGGFLLELWGLPEYVVEAISFHLCPSAVPERSYEMSGFEECGFSALTAVHVANYLCEDQDGMVDPTAKAELDNVHLEELGLNGRVEAWYDTCLARHS